MATARRQLAPEKVERETLDLIRGLLDELGQRQAAEKATINSSFERDLGLGSLDRVELVLRCEVRFGKRLPDEIAQQAETPAEWVRVLVSGGIEDGATTRYQIVQPSREASPAPESALSMVEVLRRHAERDPDRVHIHLLDDDCGEDITYGQLHERASRVAAGLLASGLGRDEAVAIMLPSCSDFFYAFFGVMMAGGIAVPIYPPARLDEIEEYVRRQVRVLRDAEVRFLISFDEARAISQLMRLQIPSLVAVTSVRALSESVSKRPGHGSLSETAFIQYTSGSTGDPKGVVVNQANVLANIRGIGWAVKFRPSDIVVTWLPLYHDMGLIGCWLFSVYWGAPITVLSPLAFLSRPERWLWALHDSGGTLCPAPNFAYELCARKIPERALEGLDLSAWRVAINAGEAVLPDTLERFAKRFEPYGFHREAYVPCYGLAESSVALAFPPLDRRPVIDTIRREAFERENRAVPAEPGDRHALRFVASGKPLPGHEVKIVDEEGRELGERVVGRVFFRGLSKTSGYFRNPAANAAVTTPDGWMDTGDLAYWANGELHITGRVKDLIIKGGRNLTPQDIEEAADAVSGVRRGCVAAFGIIDKETGTERLMVAAETRATDERVRRRIEADVMKTIDALIGIPPDKVVLVPPQSIPKTSSGKIRHNETRALYRRGELGGGQRSARLQIVRLWLATAASWLGHGLVRLETAVRRAYNATVLTTTARLAGVVSRLAHSRKSAAKIAHSATRAILALTGEKVIAEGLDRLAAGGPRLLVANRAGRLDPLLLAALLRPPFLFADGTASASLPGSMRFLLEPLVVTPAQQGSQPPVGTPGEPIRRAIDQGCSVVLFPEGRVGVPGHLSRFRLDAIRAALETGAPIYPVAIRGTAQVLEAGPNSSARTRGSKSEGLGANAVPSIKLGEAIRASAADPESAAEVRERLRQALKVLSA